MQASELYALSQGKLCEGHDECHWCSSPCKKTWMHDDLSIIFGERHKTTAKRPGNAFVCVGCWLFRRGSITVNYLSGGFKDRQKLQEHSLLVTSESACSLLTQPRSIMEKQGPCCSPLYDFLLDPPLRFSLSLVEPNCKSHVHLMVCNDLEEIKESTPLYFTLNNIPHSYSVYELKEALTSSDPSGKEPGVGALLRILGSHANNSEKERGRPTVEARANPQRLVKKK